MIHVICTYNAASDVEDDEALQDPICEEATSDHWCETLNKLLYDWQVNKPFSAEKSSLLQVFSSLVSLCHGLNSRITLW